MEEYAGMIVEAPILLAYSLIDPAGSGAAEILADLLGMEKVGEHVWRRGEVFLAGFKPDVLYLEVIEDYFKPREIIVLSRHSSKAGVKSFTVHHTGNPGSKALAGGRPGELGVADPPRAKQLLSAMARIAEEHGMVERGFEVSLEVTHHGPTSLQAPLVFAEIGSSIDEWRDSRARMVLAEAVAEAVEHRPPECIPAAGFGGGHYARKHTGIMLGTEYCYGHIYAKYAFREGLDLEVMLMAFRRSVPQARVAIVEKKSLKSADRRLVKEAADTVGVEVINI